MLEKAEPPNSQRGRAGHGLKFAMELLATNDPGVWYRSTEPVPRSAIGKKASTFAETNGIELMVRFVQVGGKQEYRLFGRVNAVTPDA